MAADGIRAGKAFVELVLRDNKYLKGLAKAAGRLRAFGVSVAMIGAKAMAAGAAAVAGPLALVTKVFVDTGSELVDLAARTGMSVEALSELGFAAGQVGSGLGDVEIGIKKMQDTITQAANGNAEAADSLKMLGLSLAELEAMGPEQQFQAMAAAIGNIDDPAKRTAAALDFFGKSGTKLIPILKDLDKARAAARAAGLTISDADAQAADTLGDKMGELWATIKVGIFQVGAAAAPMLTSLVDGVLTIVRAVTGWAKANRPLIASIMKVALSGGAIATAIGAALVAFGGASIVIGTVISGIVALSGVLAGIAAAILSVKAILVGLIVGIAAWIGHQLGAWDALWKHIREGAANVADAVLTAFGGIKDAFVAGDLELAAKIAMAGVRLVFTIGVNWLKNLWNDLIHELKTAFLELGHFLIEAGVKTWGGLETAWIEGTTFLASLFNDLFAGIVQAWHQTVGFIQKQWVKLQGLFDEGIDVQAEIAGIDAGVGASVAATQATRAGVGSALEASRAARRKANDEQTEGTVNMLAGAAQAARFGIDAAAAAEEKALRDEIEAIRGQLNAATSTAKTKADAARAALGAEPAAMPDAAAMQAEVERQAGKVQGTFSAQAASRFGGDTKVERMANGIEKIAENTRRLLRGGAGLAVDAN